MFLGSYEKAILQAVVLRYRKSFPDRLSSLSVQSQYLTTRFSFFFTIQCDPDHIASDKLITCSLESPWLLSNLGLDKGTPRKSTFIYFLYRGAGKFITLLNVISHGHKFRERKGTSFN